MALRSKTPRTYKADSQVIDRASAPMTAGQNLPSTDAPGGAFIIGAQSQGQRQRATNRWRERFNPLRGLTVSRAIMLLEQWQRGEFADPAWTYFFIEGTDPDLFALCERRSSALLELDWSVKLISGRWSRDDYRFKDFDQILAEEQAACLREAYDAIDNVYEAVEHLSTSSFRGFAHCEKFRNADGDIFHLELVDQWNMVRDLLRGPWRYNPDALSVTYWALPPENDVDPRNFLIRSTRRHIDRIALIKFFRANMTEKDWDAFLEIYGIPSGVILTFVHIFF